MIESQVPVDSLALQPAALVASPSQGRWTEFDLAHHTKQAAEWLRDAGGAVPAQLILERCQVHFSIRALLRENGHHCSSAYLTQEDWSFAETLDPLVKLFSTLTQTEIDLLKACLGKDAELALVGMDAKSIRRVSASLLRAQHLLGEPLERYENQLNRRKTRRWFAITASLVLAVTLLAGVSTALTWLKERRNLASHRLVTVSSRVDYPQVDPSRLVDGDTNNLGLHTDMALNSFAIIDLGSSKHFDTVAVYNRSDCCQERSVPLFIDVSEDGTTFHTIAERREIFEKWTAKNLHASGRYVKLRLEATNYLNLSEVEVF